MENKNNENLTGNNVSGVEPQQEQEAFSPTEPTQAFTEAEEKSDIGYAAQQPQHQQTPSVQPMPVQQPAQKTQPMPQQPTIYSTRNIGSAPQNTSVPSQPQPIVPPSPHDSKKEPRKVPGFVAVLLIICAFVLGWVAMSVVLNGGFTNLTPSKLLNPAPANNTTNVTEALQNVENQDLDKNLANIVSQAATPSVASIYTYTTTNSATDIYSYMFGQRGQSQSSEPQLSGLGSGIVIRSDGYILTNYHVIEGAEQLKVSLNDEPYNATIVGGDPTSDIAVIKIDAKDLPVLTVADSNKLQVGDWTMAIGSPYGYTSTCTTGIISALGRSTAMQSNGTTTIYTNLIQTDASINSGNSGGALVNDKAELIGVNTLISSSSGDSSGIGFAIPSNYALYIANQIIDKGTVQHAQIGVTVTNKENVVGAVISDVTKGSAADSAGLQKDDVITSVDGEKIRTASSFIYAIKAHFAGDEVKITYQRNGQDHEITVKLGGDEETSAAVQQKSKTNSGIPSIRF